MPGSEFRLREAGEINIISVQSLQTGAGLVLGGEKNRRNIDVVVDGGRSTTGEHGERGTGARCGSGSSGAPLVDGSIRLTEEESTPHCPPFCPQTTMCFGIFSKTVFHVGMLMCLVAQGPSSLFWE